MSRRIPWATATRSSTATVSARQPRRSGTVKVAVPHDQGNSNTVLEGGPLDKSTGN